MDQQLATLFESDPDLLALAQANDVAGLLAACNANTISQTNTERRSWRGVGVVDSLLAANITKYLESSIAATGAQLAADPDNPELTRLHYNLKNTLASYQNSDGINFAEGEIQTTLDTLALLGLWPQDLVTQVKALGIWYTSRAAAQFGQDLVEADVTAALAALARRQVQRQLDTWKSTADGLLQNGTLTTWDDVQAHMAATE